MQKEPQNFEELIREVYPQLRDTARRLLHNERDGHTLQPTALVHETFLKLLGKVPEGALDPQRIVRLAAHQMRQILIDYARKHNRQKRGGAFSRVPWFDIQSDSEHDVESLTAINEVLERLAKQNERAVAVVELKFFAGFTNEETARILGVSGATVEAAWQYARLWMLRELKTGKR